jgi:hypothetical protein
MTLPILKTWSINIYYTTDLLTCISLISLKDILMRIALIAEKIVPINNKFLNMPKIYTHKIAMLKKFLQSTIYASHRN